jgi:hypothetical protein
LPPSTRDEGGRIEHRRGDFIGLADARSPQTRPFFPPCRYRSIPRDGIGANARRRGFERGRFHDVFDGMLAARISQSECRAFVPVAAD